jgi:hypothetical protein
MALPILTQIRNAVWSAIDSYAALNTGIGKLNRKYKWDDSGATLDPNLTPALGELPALSIYQSGDSSPWSTNQEQQIAAVLECKLWTPELHLRRAELIWQLFHRAIWDASTGVRIQPVNQSVIQDMMITSPSRISPLPSRDETGTGDTATMTLCQWNLTCNVRWNPIHDAALNGTLSLT